MSNDVNSALPELLKEVKRANFRVSNLFHRADGQCQANLRHVSVPLVFAFAYGPCFTDALAAALEKARKGVMAPMSSVGDDARDARQIGGTTEVTSDIHPGALLDWQKGTVRTVDPAVGPVVDDDDFLGAPPADAVDDDYDLG